MEDRELWDIVAYLKHGLRAVRHQVEDSEGPPDFWASEYTVDKIGSYPAPPFPTAHETTPPEGRLQQVLRGRKLVLDHACSACHGGVWTPGQEGWLVGARTPDLVFRVDGLRVLPRNLTPHPTLGTGRYTERQIFNALRFGLRPGETPDVEITSSTPGEGNFPEKPRYLSLAMPWVAWRHMPDEDLWAIAAYLKHGVRPVAQDVPESEMPPDFWASRVTPERIGPHPSPPFPTANETVGLQTSQRR
jgi:mono/diheme cytochrome c family protein